MRSRLLLTVRALTFGALIFAVNSMADEESISLEEHPSIQVLMAQEDAWNNGDLNGFMQGYWQSEALRFVGSESVTKGWEETLARYELRYPNSETMGKLSFEVLELVPLQSEYLWMIGSWKLERSNDRPSGHFTLLWQLIDDEWLIISDHSS
ncbi:MAG: hypothetical protein ABNH02_10710 [Pseudomonadales bacterium]